MIISRRGCTTHDSPDERDPSHRFRKLETNFPYVSGFRSTLDTEELTDGGGSIGNFFVGFGRHCVKASVERSGKTVGFFGRNYVLRER